MSKEVKRHTLDGGTMSIYSEYVLASDYEALLAERDNYKAWYDDALDASNIAGFAGMSAAQVISYQSEENARLLAERDAARMRVKELDLLFGRYLLAMKAAVIDADQRGDEEGMRWIYNSLAGPGELPAEDEIDAQAFFDREIKPINDAMAELFAALQGEQP